MVSLPTISLVHGISQEELIIKAETKTWSRDSHGLFDYESTNTKNSIVFATSRHKLVRKRNDIRALVENAEIDLEDRELCRVKQLENQYYLTNYVKYQMIPTEEAINELQNKIWYVIKPEDTNNSRLINNDLYNIKINDIIKLGRVKYVVTELKIGDLCQTIDKDVVNPVFDLISNYRQNYESHSDVICKICLSGGEEELNPMVNICKCTGSISLVHFFCLKSWMQTKLAVKENEKKTVTNYSMKSFNCEICKTPYPLKIRSNEKVYPIIEYSRPQVSNYIVLESLNQVKDNNNQKSIQVITLDENEKIMMGRGHETDVRINDISVSRSHAHLSLVDGKVYLKDLKSKFGTLILVQNEILLGDKPIALQIGRTYGEFSTVSQKEWARLYKETLKNEAKNSMLSNLKPGKILFQVEKTEKNSNKSQQVFLMDVDNLSPNFEFKNSLPDDNKNNP